MVNVIIDQPDCDFYVKYYQAGCLTLNTEQQFEKSVLCFPDQAPIFWPVPSIVALSTQYWKPIIDYQPELVILGSGETQVFPEITLLLALQDKGIGIEVMNNTTACQTFNLLADEGRKVVLALIIPAGNT